MRRLFGLGIFHCLLLIPTDSIGHMPISVKGKYLFFRSGRIWRWCVVSLEFLSFSLS